MPLILVQKRQKNKSKAVKLNPSTLLYGTWPHVPALSLANHYGAASILSCSNVVDLHYHNMHGSTEML